MTRYMVDTLQADV